MWLNILQLQRTGQPLTHSHLPAGKMICGDMLIVLGVQRAPVPPMWFTPRRCSLWGDVSPQSQLCLNQQLHPFLHPAPPRTRSICVLMGTHISRPAHGLLSSYCLPPQGAKYPLCLICPIKAITPSREAVFLSIVFQVLQCFAGFCHATK